MNIIFASYRDWSLPIIKHLKCHPRVNHVQHAKDNKTLYELMKSKEVNWDMVLFAGWSTTPTKEMVDLGIPMFTEHPATSDRYTPGTPLQNQILDGVKYTKHRLVMVGFPELSPHLWSHEVDIDLTGDMEYLLEQMTITTKQLFNMFLNDYPHVVWKNWPEVSETDQMSRRTPDQSKIQLEDFSKLSTKDLYDKMRCLEDPYPNAFIEDENGILYFQKVRFKSKK